jgi:hypothetical protein
MTTGSTETSLPGSLTQDGGQEDCNLFADIKAADWLVERVGRHTNDVDLKEESSGSGLLDDIRAMDVVNMVLAEANEPLDRMADPIPLNWVKSVGWVRSGIPVVVPGKTIRFAPPTEQPRTLSDRACLSVGQFAVSTTVYARWMRPQSRGPPVCKARRPYRVTLKFLNYDHASVADHPARSGEACSSRCGFDAAWHVAVRPAIVRMAEGSPSTTDRNDMPKSLQNAAAESPFRAARRAV